MILQRSLTLTHSDTSLIARCQKADIAAFNEIVARYKSKIYNYLYRMTGNAEDAEDLTQEVFVRMYTNIGSFRAEASLSTWLFRIAGNLCVDAFRRSKKERTLVHSLDTPMGDDEDGMGATRDVPDLSHEPEILLKRKELGQHIQAALDKLPPKLRSAVVLHDVEGLAYEEIAQAERIPLGTVKSRIYNARVALRNICARIWNRRKGKKMATVLDCKKIQPQISEYVDGTLNSETAWAINLHLSSCLVCAQVASDLTATTTLLRDLPTLEPSAGFEAALARRLADQVLQPSRPSLLNRAMGWWTRPLVRPVFASTAALAALVPVAFVVLHTTQTGQAANVTDSRPTLRNQTTVATSDTGDLDELWREHHTYDASEPLGDTAGLLPTQGNTN